VIVDKEKNYSDVLRTPSGNKWTSFGKIAKCPEGTEHFDQLVAKYVNMKTHVRPYHIIANFDQFL